MATQFEFRLIGGRATEGELEADHLIAIVQSLKEVATKLSRVETEAESRGRPPMRTQRVARLSIGLAPGSTRILVRRSEGDRDELPIELVEERAFDAKFQAIIESIASDKRPGWMEDPLAIATGNVRAALQAVAPAVEFRADDEVRTSFSTDATHRETWRPLAAGPESENVTFVGRLRAVNLDTRRLLVTDDVGNKVALPHFPDDSRIGPLLGEYVTVVGKPERSAAGVLSQIHEADIKAAPVLPAGLGRGVPEATSLAHILASAPGPEVGGIPELSDEEADAFLDALGL